MDKGTEISAVQLCKPGDKDCLGLLSTLGKPGGGGILNDEYVLISIRTESILTEGGLLCNLSCVLHNPGDHALEDFRVLVFLAGVVQLDDASGRAFLPLPAVLLRIPFLAAKDTGLFYKNGFTLQGQTAGGLCWCVDKQKVPADMEAGLR